ncbi:MAG: hypothetical protein NTX91_02040 [candidate division SR1 bacterium]|nr:hypothetical protein [candidate division SR1 bacterium]
MVEAIDQQYSGDTVNEGGILGFIKKKLLALKNAIFGGASSKINDQFHKILTSPALLAKENAIRQANIQECTNKREARKNTFHLDIDTHFASPEASKAIDEIIAIYKKENDNKLARGTNEHGETMDSDTYIQLKAIKEAKGSLAYNKAVLGILLPGGGEYDLGILMESVIKYNFHNTTGIPKIDENSLTADNYFPQILLKLKDFANLNEQASREKPISFGKIYA